MNLVKEWMLDLGVVSELNTMDHWTKKHIRHRRQKTCIKWEFLTNSPKATLPCVVEMCRMFPRKFDDDNLQGAFKYIRDAIADGLIPGKKAGMADSDPRIKWVYSQEKSSAQKIRIRFYQENALQ